MDPGGVQQPGPEGDPLRGIVVAADDEDIEVSPGQPDEELVKQAHSLRRGDGLVVDIPSDHHRVGLFFLCQGKNLVQNIRLIRYQGKLVQPFSQMQVGKMKEFHFGSFPPYQARKTAAAAYTAMLINTYREPTAAA